MKYSIVFGSVLISTMLAGCSMTSSRPSQPLQSVVGNVSLQQAAGAVQAYQSSGLVGLLAQRLGVTSLQAQNGAGALFQLARNQMQPGMFSQLAQVVPEMDGLLRAAPAIQMPPTGLGGLASMAGGGGAGMLGLVSVFEQSGMSPSLIPRFIPIIVDYVKGAGGTGLAGSLGLALSGL